MKFKSIINKTRVNAFEYIINKKNTAFESGDI